MTLQMVNDRGLLLLGCGKMGSALLQGWLDAGIRENAVVVIDPAPSPWVRALAEKGLTLNPETTRPPAVCVLAVKPQMMDEALPLVGGFGGGETLFLSIAAGTPIAAFERILGSGTPIIRAMPNTPAAVGHGISALVGNRLANETQMALADRLMQAVGQTVRLESEDQMDAVTAVSGSGPAYVFHLIETLAAAGQAQGLSRELSLKLARVTVAGAGDLAEKSAQDPATLRVNVTSPGGTTAAALGVLMDPKNGFPALLPRAVAAAADRGRELGREA